MSDGTKMVVGTLYLRFVIRGSQSLKDKRQVVRSFKDRVRNRFNASVAEVGSLENCQSATLGVAVVANDHAHVQSVLASIAQLAGGLRDAELVACETEIL